MAINFNNDPYFDDYDVVGADGLTPREKYYRVLFRPGVAVQARELTQMQSILQDQVTRFGDHIFKDGSMVIPGGTFLDLEYGYVKVNALSGAAADVSLYYEEFLNTVITGQTSGIQAEVINVTAADDTTAGDPITLYVKYLDSGNTSTDKVFTVGEELESNGTTPRYATVAETGNGSAFSVNDGVYYVNGVFCNVRAQTVILSKYTTTPSYIIGFNVDETLVTSTEDANLNDNANGAPNYAAPGAHRYRIDLELIKKDLTSTDTEGFVQIAKIENGQIRQKVEKTDYSLLEDVLARRTYDESGNYTVRPFGIEVREHLLDGDNRGIYTAAEGGDETKLAIGLEKGKAYVRGYEIETLATTYVDFNKSRAFESDNNVAIPFNLGNYVVVENLYGAPDVNTFGTVSLRNTAVVSNGSAAGTEIGTARVRAIEYYQGDIGFASAQYRLFLFDIQMGSNNFADVRSVYIAGTPPTTADLISSVVEQPTLNSLLVPMPFNVIKTIRDTDGNVDTNYSIRRSFSGNLNGSGSVTLTTGINEQFTSPYMSSNFLMVVNDTVNGWTHIDLTGRTTLGGTPTGVNMTFDVSGLGYTNQAYFIIGTVYKQEAIEKTKTLQTRNLNITSPNTTPGSYDSLGKADIYRVTGIYMSGGVGTPATTSDQEVSDRYILDNGQRDSFYDLGRIQLKPTASAPTGDLLVTFEYFVHGAGDYFSVDSYTDITYDNIPTYQTSGENYPLRDVLDFRPRVNDAGTGFTGTGGSTTEIVQIGSNIRCDFDYYLGRIDKVFLDPKGDFGVIEGVSSLNPAPPKNPDNAMVLYQVEMSPYTFGPSDVIPTIVDNRRYTMRDIGRLEHRIKNLEYYTSLSLLEKETADLQIPDASNIDRFKNGFIVDPFYGHNVGNAGIADYHISVDAETGIARPQYYSDAVRLEYNSGSSSNVVKKGDTLMLDYSHSLYAEQPYASRTENVTPYLVFNWVGDMQLSPETDDWKDTERRPELIVDNQGLFDVVNLLQDETDIFGTVWNEWQTQWTGRSLSSSQTNVRGGNWTGFRTDTIETIQSTQARSGIRTSVAPDTIQTSLGDRVVDVRMVPFIRSRRVKFKGVRLKPNTRVYPFFDNIAVADFCKPETFALFSDSPVDAEPNNAAVRHPDLTATDITNGSNALITDANGTIEGEFYLPNTETVRFRTGDRVLRLSDDPEDREGFVTTSCSATYSARGLITTEQEVSLREPQIAQTSVSQTREVTSSRLVSAITTVTRRWDPLAQTFLVDQAGGIILTKVDVFFYTRDDSIPVKMEIRTVDNGYPTNTIVPFGEKFLLPSQVKLSDDASLATTFEFDTPIYLNQGREYAIVLKSASNEYRVFTSKLGENEIGTTNRISKQPTLGSLFKSQNGTTWNASQMEDLKYNMYRASFTAGSSGTVVLNNGDLPARKLNNPIYTTAGTSTVFVYHKNHGHPLGADVTISGVASDVNGIPVAELNTTHTLTHVEMDWYGFNVSTSATATGNSGGTDVYATEDKTFNILQPSINYIRLPDTNTSWSARFTTGRSLAGNESPYILDGATSYRAVLANENYETTQPYLIASPTNEANNVGGKSFWLKCNLTTDADNVSPMIDLTRSSAICVANRIDNPQAIGGGASNQNEVLNFVDEVNASDCSALARYITKKISLRDAATALKILFAGNRPDGSIIEVYYKTQAAGDDAVFDNLPWTLATSEYVPLTTEDTTKFEDYEYLDEGMTGFTYFAVKVVMKAQNSSKVPRIKDFRAIALAV